MFTREDTRKIKGLAVTMMLAHHLWAVAERVPTDMPFSIFLLPKGASLMHMLGNFCRLCVAMFMFLGGYGLWQKTRKSYSPGRDILRLYQSLWKVAIIFLPIGVLFFASQPDYAAETAICHVFANMDMDTFLYNFLGLRSTCNREWWFVLAYAGALVVGYVFIQWDRGKNFWCEAVVVILVQIVTRKLLPGLFPEESFYSLRHDWFYTLLIGFNYTVCSFFMGIVFAKYDALAKLWQALVDSKPRWVRLVISLPGTGILVWMRTRGPGMDLDILFVPLFIVFALEWLDFLRPVSRVFLFLGGHSTNMWFIHTFYCYYFYPAVRVVYWSGSPLVALITLLTMTLLSSMALEALWKGIGKGWRKLTASSPGEAGPGNS